MHFKRFSKLLSLLMILCLPLFTPSSEEAAPLIEIPVMTKVRAEAYETPTVVFHYHRTDSVYTNWDLWLWSTAITGSAFKFTGDDSYGKYIEVPVSTFQLVDESSYIGVIVRPGAWTQQTSDMFIYLLRDYEVGANNDYHFYFVDLESQVYLSIDDAIGEKVKTAQFIDVKSIAVTTNAEPQSYEVLENEAVISSGSAGATLNKGTYAFTISLETDFTPDFALPYIVRVLFVSTAIKEREVNFTGLFDSQFFEDTYVYDGDDLGVTYTPTQSTFKLWAPTSSVVKLRIYNNGTPTAIDAVSGDNTYTEHIMTLGDKGVWSTVLTGDYHGKYYTYYVKNAAYEGETQDPYTKAAGINGIRGMIVDFSQTNPAGWDEVTLPTVKPTELVVYELHVADLTSAATWNGSETNRKKFHGLIEGGTTYTEGAVTVKTGFDHIKEMGINALQILPFFDQSNDEVNVSFNWGYNPLNYNVIEGAYSSNPYDGLVRIQELKQVVKAYAEADIRIIMDVVYNHVASITGSSLHKVVPQYYFRYNSSGSPSNGSGVGNDTASERAMMRKLMVDSTEFWASEYKLGGYRFDLMGLHDVDTMQELTDNIKTFDDDFVVFGEPWEMSGTVPTKDGVTLSHYKNLDEMTDVGGFNDMMRDGVKGSALTGNIKGWIQNTTPSATDTNRVMDGIKGQVTGGIKNPAQVVNYVSCHDNHTLFDKIQLTATDRTAADRAKMDVQANAMVLTSQGIGFIHAGEEMMRSKPISAGVYDHNSYQSSYEINAIHWERKVQYLKEVQQYQQLIELKTSAPAFQYMTKAEVDANVVVTDGADISGLTAATIVAQTSDENYAYIIIHNGVRPPVKLDKIGVSVADYQVYIDTSGTLSEGTAANDTLSVSNNTTLILRKDLNPVIEPPSSEPITSEPTSEGRGGCGGSIVATGSTILFSFGLIAIFAFKNRKVAV